MQEVYSNWVIDETKVSNFSDKRLNNRFKKLVSHFADSPNKSIPNSFKSWGETITAYRFFNHDEVDKASILSSHYAASLERIKKEPIVLIPQDTSTIDFSKRCPIEGMGYLNDEESQGFYLHPSLAITPEKQCLGLIDFQAWAREKLGARATRKAKSIEEKESYCWLKAYEAANQVALASPETTMRQV